MGRQESPKPRPARPARRDLEQTQVGGLPGWKLEEAKARFSEVVRRAREEGPQRVTYRGRDAVVVIAVDELKRVLPGEKPADSLVDFLRSTALGELEVERSRDRGRDPAL